MIDFILFKTEEVAGDNSKFDENIKKFSKGLENTASWPLNKNLDQSKFKENIRSIYHRTCLVKNWSGKSRVCITEK